MHIASILGGVTHGVARYITLHSVCALGILQCSQRLGLGDWSNIGQKLIVSLSLGGSCLDSTNMAVERVMKTGIAVVDIAGNNNGDACNMLHTLAVNAIIVGATTLSDIFAHFSN